jgi:hypothetical protein
MAISRGCPRGWTLAVCRVFLGVLVREHPVELAWVPLLVRVLVLRRDLLEAELLLVVLVLILAALEDEELVEEGVLGTLKRVEGAVHMGRVGPWTYLADQLLHLR